MKNKTRTHYIIYNLIASGGGYFFNIVISFICRKIFILFLPAEYLGLNGLFSNILSMLSLAELGIGTAITCELYKPIARKDYSKIAAYMKAYGIVYKIIGVIVGVLGLAMLPFLNILVNKPANIDENIHILYLLYLFSIVINYFFSYRSSLLIANQKNYVVIGINYIIVILQNLFQILVLWLYENYLLYLILQIFFGIISSIYTSYISKKEYSFIFEIKDSKLSYEEVKRLIVNVKALTVTKLSGILVNNTDNIVITYFNGLIATGYVSNYTLFIGIISSILSQLFSSITATVGSVNAHDDNEKKYMMFNSLTFLNYWLYSISTIIIIILSNDLISFIFGPKLIMDFNISIILGVNFYMIGMQNIVGMYKSTLGLFKYGQYMLLVTAVLNLTGDIILGARYGIFGIFLATALARLFSNTFYEPYVVHKYGFNMDFLPYVKKYLYFIVLLIISTVITYGLCLFISEYTIISIILKFIICISIHSIILFIIFHNTTEFLYLKKFFSNIYKLIYSYLKFK